MLSVVDERADDVVAGGAGGERAEKYSIACARDREAVRSLPGPYIVGRKSACERLTSRHNG